MRTTINRETTERWPCKMRDERCAIYILLYMVDEILILAWRVMLGVVAIDHKFLATYVAWK